MKRLLTVFATLPLLIVTPVFAADMPQAGSPAPTFTLPGQDGMNVSLSDYRGRWVMLYFYPKDFTSGCSLEAHNFQTDSAKFSADNAIIIGVSVDNVASHKSFCIGRGLISNCSPMKNIRSANSMARP